MKLYDFSRLIRKYSVEFSLTKSQGEYVGGKWEQTEEAVEKMNGAIVPMSDRKIYTSGGTYTQGDRELYLTKPLTGDLSDFTVLYKGNTFKVEESRNFGDYADVYIYILKHIKAGEAK